MKYTNLIRMMIGLLCTVASAHAAQSAGDLDPSFGNGGKVITDFGYNFEQALGVVIQPDGKIVAAGGGGNTFFLARYNTNGALDSTFDGDGRVTASLPAGASLATDVALQPDGRIIAVGAVGGAGSLDWLVVRYNADGSLDSTFNGSGMVRTDFTGDDSARAVTVQSNGKIIVIGSSGARDFAVARYNSNGTLDTTFSVDGKATADFGQNEVGFSVALEGDGRIVVAGQTYPDTAQNVNFALARFTSDGTLDNSFDGDGRVVTDFGANDGASSVIVQPDGKILAGGASHGGPTDQFVVARYNPTDGSLDLTFGGGDGKATGGTGNGTVTMHGLALQSNGKIVAVGNTLYVGGPVSDFAVARYNSDGTFDTTFGANGWVKTDFGGSDVAWDVAIQSDGQIVSAGGGGGNFNDGFTLARYLDNSVPEPGILPLLALSALMLRRPYRPWQSQRATL